MWGSRSLGARPRLHSLLAVAALYFVELQNGEVLPKTSVQSCPLHRSRSVRQTELADASITPQAQVQEAKSGLRSKQVERELSACRPSCRGGRREHSVEFPWNQGTRMELQRGTCSTIMRPLIQSGAAVSGCHPPVRSARISSSASTPYSISSGGWADGVAEHPSRWSPPLSQLRLDREHGHVAADDRCKLPTSARESAAVKRNNSLCFSVGRGRGG